MNKINKELAIDILRSMPEEKKVALHNALCRTESLTSTFSLSTLDMTICKEGWYLEFKGTRCSFSVWAYDRDGEFEFARKPKNLSVIYTAWGHLNEDDFLEF